VYNAQHHGIQKQSFPRPHQQQVLRRTHGATSLLQAASWFDADTHAASAPHHAAAGRPLTLLSTPMMQFANTTDRK
jgi:hypothetical protein